VTASTPLRGFLDHADWHGAEGWAFNPDDRSERIELEIVDNGRPIRTVVADRPRAGLAEAGIGDGGHSFQVVFDPPLSHAEHHVLRVRRRTDGRELEKSGVILEAKQEAPGDDAIRLHIDSPAIADGKAEIGPHSGLFIEGWAVALHKVAEIEIFLDGASIGLARHGLPRKGLDAAFPAYPDALHGGFAFSASRRPADGVHKVTVVVRDWHGIANSSEFSLNALPASSGPGAWSIRRQVGAAERALKLGLIETVQHPPSYVVALIVPTPDATARDAVEVTLSSLRRQAYPAWQVAIVAPEGDSAAGAPPAGPDLESHMLAEGDIPAALAANGAQLVVLHAGDELGVDALLELAAASVREPEADFVYGDEQRIDPATGRLAPCFKPGWSPELLLSTNYIGRPWAVSADLVRRAAVSVADGDYDLALRLTEQAAKIVHVPRILCRRGAEPVDHADRDRPALARATERRGIAGEVLAGGVPGLYRLKRAVSTTGLVSIVMPTAGVGGLVKKAIGTLRAVTAYRNVEIVVVDNIPDGDAAMRDWVKQNADTVVRLDAPFNWSRFNNEGVAAAKGEFLLFLNDDIEIVQPDWLDALLEHAERPEVGIVGPKLLYPDSGGVQSAGAFLSDTGGRNAFRFLEADAPGPFGLAMTQRDVVAVTGACMMVRRDVFDRLGGFDEAHDIVNNDLDFCLRAHRAGLRAVFTPYATVIHHEKASRSNLEESHDSERFTAAWGTFFAEGDPFFSPHLSKSYDDFIPDPEPVEIVYPARPLGRPDDVRSILVLKPDQIGDFVTAFPAFRRLKENFPGATLTVLAAPASLELQQLEPAIDWMIPLNGLDLRRTLADGFADDETLAAAMRPLRASGFDLAIDMRRQPETRVLLQRTGARWLAGFDPGGLFPWLDVAEPWVGDRQRIGRQRSAGADLVALADAVGQAFRPAEPLRTPSRREARTAVAGIEALAPILAGWVDRRIAVIHPGAGAENRRWPAEHFAGLIDLLAEQADMRCLVAGAADDMEIVEAVTVQVKDQDRVRAIAGQVPLGDLPLLLAACDLFVGNNSGPQHIAAALGVPTVNVHPGVIDPSEWAGVGPATLSVRRAVSCSPCYLAEVGQCHRDLACLRGLSPRDVFSACRELLGLVTTPHLSQHEESLR
jgi:ADP-heptose:LPS heptosyltransferase/GT2 family glycosyltransferase